MRRVGLAVIFLTLRFLSASFAGDGVMGGSDQVAGVLGIIGGRVRLDSPNTGENMRNAMTLAAVVTAASMGLGASASVTLTTATFQNGVDGYTGTFDRRITATGAGTGGNDGAAVNTDSASFFVDGGTSTLDDTGAQEGLIRFDQLTIPAGAKIISSSITLRTNASSNAQSNGSYNIYPMTAAISSATTYAGLGGNGIRGDIGAILGSFDGQNAVNTVVSARVDRAVQGWANGGTNLGFGIRSDRTTDGWSYHTTGSATVANRPQLSVTYTTDADVMITSYQLGNNGYTGGLDASLNNTVTDPTSGADVTGVTVPGSSVAETFIDGFEITQVGSIDTPYLLKFSGLDLNVASIFKAELVIKTGFSSSAADSPGPISVHRMLRDWDTTTTYASLDSDGDPTKTLIDELITGGVISTASAAFTGMNDTEVMHLDVTNLVADWQSGAANYGFYLGAGTGTDNAWQIFTNGALDPNFRPELRIVAVVPEPTSLAGLMLAGGLLARRRAR